MKTLSLILFTILAACTHDRRRVIVDRHVDEGYTAPPLELIEVDHRSVAFFLLDGEQAGLILDGLWLDIETEGGEHIELAWDELWQPAAWLAGRSSVMTRAELGLDPR